MFNKIKALKDIRSQAKELEKVLADVTATGSSKGLTVTINGKQEILSLDIPEDMDRDKIADALKEALNSAFKDIQKDVQKAMKDMGGLPDLSQLGM